MKTRSRTLAEQSESTPQAILTEAGAGPTISVNWYFLNISNSYNDVLTIEIPYSLFDGTSQKCQTLFANEILDAFKFKPHIRSITFWKPKRPLLPNETGEEWTQDIKNIKDRFHLIFSMQSFAKELNQIDNKDTVHLVVTIRDSYSPKATIEGHEEDDILTDLPEFQRYNNTVSTIGKSPSVGARSKEYASCQSSPNEVIYDGRHPPEPKLVTVAPPIQIFHPIFEKFTRLIDDPSVQPTDDDLRLTQKLMHTLSVIETKWDVLQRNNKIPKELVKILGIDIHEELNIDKSLADGVHIFVVDDIRIPLLIIELKRELGEGGSDPSTQASFSMRRSWIQPDLSQIRDKCCCPTLMLSGGGPWMSILGGVFTDKFIVQRLTDMIWLGHSSTEEDARIYRFARAMNALRTCILDLQTYYTEIWAAQNLTLMPKRVHPRFYPYPTSFLDGNNQTVDFKFLEPLEQDDPVCVTYKAKTSKENIIVVKFVTRYSTEVHKFLADKGHAPRLLYSGPLSRTGILHESSGRLPHPGLSLGPMQMIVMDYIECKEAPADVRGQLEAILEELHVAGYVFGDLRPPNVLFDEKGKVKLIDFDWAGLFDMTIHDVSRPELQQKIKDSWEKRNRNQPDSGYVCYPLNMSSTVEWAEGVGDLKPIRPIHDWDMLDKLPL